MSLATPLHENMTMTTTPDKALPLCLNDGFKELRSLLGQGEVTLEWARRACRLCRWIMREVILAPAPGAADTALELFSECAEKMPDIGEIGLRRGNIAYRITNLKHLKANEPLESFDDEA